MSPGLGWEHIGLAGNYVWTENLDGDGPLRAIRAARAIRSTFPAGGLVYDAEGNELFGIAHSFPLVTWYPIG